MAENFIPIVSNTPPPLDDFDDDDDDFTGFTTAENHWAEDNEDFSDCPLPERKDSFDSPTKMFISNSDSVKDVISCNELPTIDENNDSFVMEEDQTQNKVESTNLHTFKNIVDNKESNESTLNHCDQQTTRVCEHNIQNPSKDSPDDEFLDCDKEISDKIEVKDVPESSEQTSSKCLSNQSNESLKKQSSGDSLPNHNDQSPFSSKLSNAQAAEVDSLNGSSSFKSEEKNFLKPQHDGEVNMSPPNDEFTNFAEFQIQPTVISSCEEAQSDNEEFADFSNVPVRLTERNTTVTASKPDLSDDFGDFEEMPMPQAMPELSNIESNTEKSSFADFKEANFTSQTAANDNFVSFNDFQRQTSDSEDDDFGDFSSISVKTEEQQGEHLSYSDFTKDNRKKLEDWFPLLKVPSNIELQVSKSIHCHVDNDIIQLLSSKEHSTETNNQTYTSRPSQVWDLLEDVDNAIALKHQWTNSMHHQQLLTTLSINTQNILFGRTSKPYYIPTYYAAGLGLLEPGKDIIKPLSAAEKITALSPKDKSPTNLEENTKSWTTETGVGSAVLASGVGACHDVYSKLHQTNNNLSLSTTSLDHSNLNFDVFNNSLNSKPQTASEQDKFDPELLELAKDVTPDQTSKKADPLSKILATLRVSSSKKLEDDEDLSEDAIKAIKKLPQISYMRSKVLMFPVGQSSPVHN